MNNLTGKIYGKNPVMIHCSSNKMVCGMFCGLWYVIDHHLFAKT